MLRNADQIRGARARLDTLALSFNFMKHGYETSNVNAPEFDVHGGDNVVQFQPKVRFTRFADQRAQHLQEQEMSLPALAKLIYETSAPAKDKLPWISSPCSASGAATGTASATTTT
jgi:hypothetical protein